MIFRCAMLRQTPAGEEVTFVSHDRTRKLVLVHQERANGDFAKYVVGRDYELPDPPKETRKP